MAASAQTMTVQMQAKARDWLDNQGNLLQEQACAAVQKAQQDMLQQRADMQAQAQDHVQQLHNVAKNTIDTMKEQGKVFAAHADAKCRAQELDNQSIREEAAAAAVHAPTLGADGHVRVRHPPQAALCLDRVGLQPHARSAAAL